MNVVIIQSPLVQLNAPYPSGAYLKAFFTNFGHNATWQDFSIKLVHKIFCKQGLQKLFDLTKQNALLLAKNAESKKDFETAKNLRRYVMQSSAWIEWIDFIMAILCGTQNPSAREVCHKFIFSAHTPRGLRMERYLQNLPTNVTVDDAKNLATMAIEDLADYITYVFDKDFSLVRYAESIAMNETSFENIEKKLDSPVLKTFYKEVLDDYFEKNPVLEKTLFCISVPFAGTFIPALWTAKYLRKKFGNKTFISIGGGFVNTELRDFCDTKFFEYADALSFDRGYGSYKNLFDLIEENKFSSINESLSSIYKMRIFFKNKVIEMQEENVLYQTFENEQTIITVPDYSEIDFSLYPRVADDTNPMQRLWSDGAWIKAYLAHGCYWHKCAFCDVTLDYVASYKVTQVEKLFAGLKSQSKEKGVYGIHFVDEALPPSSLVKFAKLNIEENANLSFWGNVRFENVYSRDVADFLSYGGLIGVSGGIEIATGCGLDSVNKGTSIDSIVSACCAFKESGILVHAYMIYGYFGESEQDTINSMETLRQFYKAGLLDSCFWHKFVLTRHSRIYSEWKDGMHKNLKPIEPKTNAIFAKNGLHFEGEEKSSKYAEGLNNSLQNWMHGENINLPVEKWFNFKVCKPTVDSNLINKSIQKYEEKRESQWKAELNAEKLFWLAGEIIFNENKLLWNYMQEDFCFYIKPFNFNEFEKALKLLSPKNHDSTYMKNLLQKDANVKKILLELRGKGLVLL